MRFRSLLLPLAAFIAAVFAYRFTTELAIAYLWLPQPTWWDWQAPRVVTAMTWMHVTHGIGMLAGALPVALALRLLPVRRPVVRAAWLALVALVLPGLWLSLHEGWGYSTRMQWSMASDLVKFAGVLPLLTWVLPQLRRPPPALTARSSGAPAGQCQACDTATPHCAARLRHERRLDGTGAAGDAGRVGQNRPLPPGLQARHLAPGRTARHAG